MAQSFGQSKITRRTLHYYSLATRKHLGLYLGMVLSTIGYVALLSYANPYVMSLIVDRISAGPVEADQVFTVFGPYIAALLAINVCGQAFLRILFRSDLTDLTSPMQIAPAALYRKINWKESGFPFFLEMVLIPLRLGVEIHELPAKSLPRSEGKSKNSFLHTFAYLFTAVRIRFTPKDKLVIQ